MSHVVRHSFQFWTERDYGPTEGALISEHTMEPIWAFAKNTPECTLAAAHLDDAVGIAWHDPNREPGRQWWAEGLSESGKHIWVECGASFADIADEFHARYVADEGWKPDPTCSTPIHHFATLLQRHDWTYQYSDDFSAWSRGADSWDAILRYSRVLPAPVVRALWNRYAPKDFACPVP